MHMLSSHYECAEISWCCTNYKLQTCFISHDIPWSPYLQGREMGEKVVANKETHEDPVINHILKVILERETINS